LAWAIQNFRKRICANANVLIKLYLISARSTIGGNHLFLSIASHSKFIMKILEEDTPLTKLTGSQTGSVGLVNEVVVTIVTVLKQFLTPENHSKLSVLH